MRRIFLACVLLAVLGVLSISAPEVSAKGPPVVNETERIVNKVDTFIDVHPCTGEPAELTIVFSGAIHFIAFEDGTVHFNGTLRGTFTADVLPTDGVPDATGRFTNTFGGNGSLNEDETAFGKGVTSTTLNGKLTDADGNRSSFHLNAHVVFDDAGVPKLEFEKAHCN